MNSNLPFIFSGKRPVLPENIYIRAMGNQRKTLPEIRISGVSPQVHKDLLAIASNECVSLSDLLKPHLRTIRDSYPEKMRKKES